MALIRVSYRPTLAPDDYKRLRRERRLKRTLQAEAAIRAWAQAHGFALRVLNGGHQLWLATSLLIGKFEGQCLSAIRASAQDVPQASPPRPRSAPAGQAVRLVQFQKRGLSLTGKGHTLLCCDRDCA